MQILLFATLGAIILIYLLLCKLAPEKLKATLRKKWWILLALLLVVYFTITSIAQNSATLSKEEIVARLEDKLIQQLQEFDDEYSCEGSTVQISFTELDFIHPSLSLGNDNLVGAGLIEGFVRVVVNTPAAYPYLEKPEGTLTIDDVNSFLSIRNELLDCFDLEERYPNYQTIVSDIYMTDVYVSTDITFLDSAGNEYTVDTGWNDQDILKNGEVIFTKRLPKWSSGYSGGSSSGGSYPCSWCGGDGKTHDWGTEMHGSGYTCWKCGGDGRL